MRRFRSTVSSPVNVTFDLQARVIALENQQTIPSCPHCGTTLNLHQPDEGTPNQLLGTCESCSHWYFLIELEQEWSEVLVVDLPCEALIRGMFKRAGAQDGLKSIER